MADVIDRNIKGVTKFGLDLPFIQINNVHGAPGSSGSPVFNSTGGVIGMSIYVDANMDFVVPASILGDVLQTAIDHDTGPSRGKKPREETKWKGKKKVKWYRH